MGLNLSGTIFEGDFASFDEISDVYDSVMALICVLSAGLAAGLTMGLLSLDNTKLEIKAMIGTDEDRAYASALLPLIKKHHLLLVTLMLSNSLANEALPIFLGSLVPNYLAILVSVVLVLICGEIVPSALFTGPRQLQMSARLANVVWFLLALFYPIAYPLSRVLDYFFGAEEADSTVSRVELEALMTLQSEGYTPQHRGSRIEVFPHRTPASGSFGPTSPLLHSAECGGNNRKKRESLLSIREVSIMTGILKLSKLTISSVLIAISDVYMIPFDLILDEDNIADILVSGFSRIPVYKRSREIIAGFLLVKTLAVVNPSHKIRVGSLFLHQPLVVKPTLGLLEMLTVFQEGHRHMALISESPTKAILAFRDEEAPKSFAKILGMITLEDVLEKILQEEIIDETDDLPTKLAHGHSRFKTSKLCRPHPSSLNLAVASGEQSGMLADVEQKESALQINSLTSSSDGAVLYSSLS